MTEKDYIIARAHNQTGSAEGSVLPPRQVGSTRVPIVGNLRVMKTEPFLGGTQFTIAFDDAPPGIKIANYNLYYSINGSGDLNNAGICRQSPAKVFVNGPTASTVAIIVQTYMQNGFSSDISQSPSCTGMTLAAGGFDVDPTIRTAAFSPGSFWLTQVDTSAGSVTVTLPLAAGIPGRWYIFKKSAGDANTLTVSRDGTDTIDGATTAGVSSAYGRISIVRLTADTWGLI